MEESFDNLVTAADTLISKLKSELPGTKIGVTTAPRGFSDAHGAFSGDGLLTNRQVDFFSLQAYQPTHSLQKSKIQGQKGKLVCDPNKYTGINAPRVMLNRAITLLSKLDLGGKQVILGLSAFQLDCPPDQHPYGVEGKINMYATTKRSICGASEIRNIMGDAYFSEDNIVKQWKKSNNYAREFLDSCRVSKIADFCGNADNDNDENIISEIKQSCPTLLKARSK
jgi:hypothetical protein